MKRVEFVSLVEDILGNINPAGYIPGKKDYHSDAESIATYVIDKNFTIRDAVQGVLGFQLMDEEKVRLTARKINEELC